MKKKDVYELTIKIIGIIAAWKFIESIIASVVVYIMLHCVSTNINIGMMGVSQTNFSIMYFVFIAFYGLFGYLFLFHTDKILHLFRLTDPTEVTLQIGKKMIYHIAVLLFGFFMFIYSANQLVTSTFSKTDATSTEKTTEQLGTQGPNGENIKTVVGTSSSPISTTTTTVNYVNILLTLLSILIIIKSQKISGILMPKEEEELTSSLLG